MKKPLESCEVLVVGAGPAGACATRDLAREGIRVTLLEKFPIPRYKTCGGGVVRRALRWMPVDISAVVETLCPVAELRMEALHFPVRRPHPIVTMTMRARLDQLLVEAAESAGAAVLPEHEVIGVSCGEKAVEVRTRRSVLRARFVIAADGATSPVARLADRGPSPRLIPALEWELPATARLRENFQTARFDFTTSGYGWVFPKKEHLSVGVLDMGVRHRPLKAFLNGYREEREIPASKAPPPRGAAIPIRPSQPYPTSEYCWWVMRLDWPIP